MATKRRATGHSTTKRRGRGSTVTGPSRAPFRLDYPGGWRRIARAELHRMKTPPIAGLRRSDAQGVLFLTIRGPLLRTLDELGPKLVAKLGERLTDFELVTSKVIDVAAGPALYTSWVRPADGRVQANLTVPVGDLTYSIDATLPTGASEVARDVGAIMASFQADPASDPA